VPTHTWEEVTQKNPYYDVRASVPNIGAVPRAAAFRSDGFRSLHPTHSIWAHGVGAEEFVRNEENAGSPAATGFCWDKLADFHTKILLIGVENDKNTFIHSVDERAKLPDRISEDFFTVTIVDGEGNVLKKPMHYHKCSKTDDISIYYGNFEKPMVEMGIQTFGKLGNAQVRIIDAMACRELIMGIYQRATEDIFAQHIELPESLYK
jgi:aminoglycoside 3-N-acetyltransferase